MFVDVPAGVGYPLLFAFVGGESAGLLLPGETALIVAAALASEGKLAFTTVVAVAAGAAIIGDNIGYVLGRNGLHHLLVRPGRAAAVRKTAILRSEAFFERHGSFAVFAGRWIPGLRIAAAWIAGVTRMPWPRFLAWNALGGIAWATSVGAAAYGLGRQASGILTTVGFGFLGIVALGFGLRIAVRRSFAGHQASTRSLPDPRPVFNLALARSRQRSRDRVGKELE